MTQEAQPGISAKRITQKAQPSIWAKNITLDFFEFTTYLKIVAVHIHPNGSGAPWWK